MTDAERLEKIEQAKLETTHTLQCLLAEMYAIIGLAHERSTVEQLHEVSGLYLIAEAELLFRGVEIGEYSNPEACVSEGA